MLTLTVRVANLGHCFIGHGKKLRSREGRNLARCPLNPEFWRCSPDHFNGSLSQTRNRLWQNWQAKCLVGLGVIVIVQLLSHVWLFATPWTAVHWDSLSFLISQSELKLMSIESEMLSSHLIFCLPFSSYPLSFPASRSFPMNWLFHCVSFSKFHPAFPL